MRSDTGRLKPYLVFAGDALLLYGALALALALRYRGAPDQRTLAAHVSAFTPIFAVWLLVFYANRLYDRIGPKTITALLRDALPPLLINLALAVAYFYLFSSRLPGTISPRTNLAIFFVLFTILFIGWRRLVSKLFGKTFRIRTAIIGQDSATAALTELLHDRPEYGYQIAFAAPADEWSIDLVRKLIHDDQVTTIIASPHSIERLAPHIAELATMNIDFWDVASFYEARIEKIPLGALDEPWLLENIVRREPKLFTFAKNVVDRIAALIGIFITIPLWPLIALGVRLSSPGPVFYRQLRVGKGGQPFELLKFRTMYQDAETAGAVWAKENDPRVTPFGRILRKTQLDELPQLLNILRGEMSFVGPRPERPEFVTQLRQAIPFYDLRHLVKPGLTGWAQLNFRYGASVEDAKEKLEYDLFYIKNRSLALDLVIMLKTLHIILRGGTGR